MPDSVGGEHDPPYQARVFAAVTAILDYCLEAIEHGGEWSGPVPPKAVAQAHRAAGAGVNSGIELRRYVAGHGRLGEFVAEEAAHIGLSSNGPVLHHLRRTQETLLERLTAAIEHEYDQERERLSRSPEQRRAEIVQSILTGAPDPSDIAELDYDIHSSWHVALVATGAGAGEVFDRLKAHFGRRVLLVVIDGTLWAWLGGQEKPSEKDIEGAAVDRSRSALGISEPGLGLDGWRLTHDQALAALAVALRRSRGVALYADDRLLAAALQNDTLARSLRQKYLMPLRSHRDGGAKLRLTLRTYIDLDCNATSAGHVLKVGRRAVKSRICTAERLIGSPLHECLAELDVALRLGDLDMAVAAE